MRTILICLTLALSGCVNADTTYVDGTGRWAQCSGVGWGLIGATVAEIAYQKCKTAYVANGWTEKP
jgi:hypothetical protein